MPPVLEQTAYNTVAKYQSRTCTVTFDQPTKPGSLLIAVSAAAGTLPSDLKITPSDFTYIEEPGMRDIQMSVWYWENAPSIRSVSVRAQDDNKSQQVRLFEYSGMAQENVVDRTEERTSGGFERESRDVKTWETDETSQANELVLAFICNQDADSVQSGFKGNLSKLYDQTSPQKWSGGTNKWWERSRLSIHQAIATQTDEFKLECQLSTKRRWLTLLVTFRASDADGNTGIGPARMTSSEQTIPMVSCGGRGDLTVFGPLKSGVDVEQPHMLNTSSDAEFGRIGPFNYQYRFGGWSGLLVGSGTQFHVQGTRGLNGWEIRTSDEPRPRADGSYRGIDLSGAREVRFRMNVGRGRLDVERNMDTLYRYLIPQVDTDWELIWRHPPFGLKMMRVRPGNLERDRNNRQIIIAEQEFLLRAADPRHYSAVPNKVIIPVTADGATEPDIQQIINLGNSPAYPVITIDGPPTGDPVTRIRLVNETALVNLELDLILQADSRVVADMDARITGAPRSIITLDGQTKYGAWQLPREPFRIDPDPTGFGGYNEIYLETEPAGAPITCTLEYRDTWYG